MRGFYTNPSRADDSFIPFKSNPKIVLNTTMTLEYNKEISTGIDAKVGSVICARINNYYYLFGMILENEIKEFYSNGVYLRVVGNKIALFKTGSSGAETAEVIIIQ